MASPHHACDLCVAAREKFSGSLAACRSVSNRQRHGVKGRRASAASVGSSFRPHELSFFVFLPAAQTLFGGRGSASLGSKTAWLASWHGWLLLLAYDNPAISMHYSNKVNAHMRRRRPAPGFYRLTRMGRAGSAPFFSAASSSHQPSNHTTTTTQRGETKHCITVVAGQPSFS